MDRKSKIFFIVLAVMVALSIVVSYFKFMVFRDYIVEAQANCDPATEACFVHECDSTAGETCSGKPEEDTSYYKLIKRSAKNIPTCDPAADGCAAYVCPAGEAGCEISLCSEATLADLKSSDTCNDPVEYAAKHPATDETGQNDSSNPAPDGAGNTGATGTDQTSVGSPVNSGE